MGILDSIKDLASKAVDTVKGTVDNVTETATEAYNEAGGVDGLLNKAKTGLSDLADTARDTASNAVDKIKGTDDTAPKA